MNRRVPVVSGLLALGYWLLDSMLAAVTGDVGIGSALLFDDSGALPIARVLSAGLVFGSGMMTARLLRYSGQPATGGEGGHSLADALRRRNEELEAIFSNPAVLIAVMDRNFNFVRVNKSYAARKGSTPEELVGKNHFDLFPHQENQRIFREVVETGVPCHATARAFSDPSYPGHIRYWDWTLSPLKRPDDSVYGVLLSLIDVTRRVNDWSKIANLSRLYKVLSEANKAIARVKSRDELLGTICRIMVEKGEFGLAWIGVPDSHDEQIIPIASAGDHSGYLRGIRISLKEPAHADSPAVTALRRGLPVVVSDIATDECFVPWSEQALQRGYRSATAFPIRQGEEVFGVLAALSGEPDFFAQERVTLMSDLSEDISFALEALDQEERRVAAEEALHRAHGDLEARVFRRTVELEQMNRQQESFSYSVSHDLRGPLRAINGYSTLLLEDWWDKLDEEGRDALHRIQNASNRMDWLIDGLLTLSRIARTQLHLRELDLCAIAQQVITELRETEPCRRVAFTCPPRLIAFADPYLARVALNNLLGNAWKFTGRRAQGEIELGMRREGAGFYFFVRDNGAGFDMAHARNLFGPFQRLHGPAEFPGTGIGLATVARIVEVHGGHIRAEGREGEGAVFYFTFGPHPTPETGQSSLTESATSA